MSKGIHTKLDTSKDKSKKRLLVIITVLLIVVVALVVFIAVMLRKPSNKKNEASKGVVGRISDGWDTGLEDEPQSPSKGIQIPGYATAVMKEGDMSLHLSIGNPKENECGFYATLKLADGTILYESDLLRPGQGLTEVPLNKTLDSGEYTALVYYRCVTLDEEQSPLNSAESEFKLIVE